MNHDKILKPEEERILRDYYPTEGYRGVNRRWVEAGFVERKQSNMAHLAKKRGIKAGSTGRFQPGHGKGAGRKMSAQHRERASKTMFKAGHQPPHTLYPFALNKNSRHGGGDRWYVKTEAGNWLPLERWMWCEANGDVPQGHHVLVEDSDAFDRLVKAHGFRERLARGEKEPPGHWPRLLGLVRAAQPMLRLESRSEMIARVMDFSLNTRHARDLGFNYVAGMAMRGDAALREWVKREHPELILLAQQNMRLRREINKKKAD